MHWLKTWLRKWLGIDQQAELIVNLRREDLALIRDLTARTNERVAEIGRENAELIQRLDTNDSAFRAIDSDRTGIRELFDRVRADLIDITKASETNQRSIAELESIVKDATLDTALLALEDRVSKLESAPAPNGSQGRRGGSAWNSHQVAAAAGAALTNGVPNPIPTPGVS